MARNDFLVWAGSPSANVMSQAAYGALPYLGTGVVGGIASSSHANKAWRQSSIISSVIGALINGDVGADAIDDGTTATLLANLRQAVANIGVTSFSAVTGGGYTYRLQDEGKLVQRTNNGGLMWDYLPPASALNALSAGGLLTIRNADRAALLVIQAMQSSSFEGSFGSTGRIILGPGQVARIVHDGGGTYFCVEKPTRAKLGSNIILFVENNGNDANTGLTGSDPMQTGQAAVNRLLHEYDYNGFASAIGFGNGTFTGNINIPYAPLGAPQGFSIALNGAGPSATTLTATGGATLTVTHASVILGQTTLANGATTQFLPYDPNGYVLNVGAGGDVGIDQGINFGPALGVHMATSAGGVISTGGNPYTISGSAGYHIVCGSAGHIVPVDSVITLVGNPNFSKTFAFCYGNGCFEIWGSSFSGTATGQKFVISTNGSIITNGMSVDFLPGNVAGVTVSGGVYA